MNINEAFKLEQKEYFQSKVSQNKFEKWSHLERMHILGQKFLSKHFYIHCPMLQEAIVDRNTKETLGQMLRLLLVLPGHLFQTLPMGNIGSSRVSVFVPMSIPEDLKQYFPGNKVSDE